MSFEGMLMVIPGAGLLALIYAYVKARQVNQADSGTAKMVEIGGHIREGAMAFLGREYKVLAIFVIAVAVLLAAANAKMESSSWMVGLSFIVGAVCSVEIPLPAGPRKPFQSAAGRDAAAVQMMTRLVVNHRNRSVMRMIPWMMQCREVETTIERQE